VGPRNGRHKPIFFLHWGREGQKALAHVATLGSAGGCGQDGGRDDGGDGGDGCSSGGPWKSTVEAVVTRPRPDASVDSPGATKNTSSLRASVAEARLENPDRDQSTSSSFFGTSRPFPTCLHKGKGASNFKGPVQASAVRRSERLAKAGSNMLISAVPPFGRLSGTRCWPALGLQTRALKRPFSAAEASTGHLSLHGHVERPCLARPTAWSTAQRRSDRLRLTNDEKPSREAKEATISSLPRRTDSP